MTQSNANTSQIDLDNKAEALDSMPITKHLMILRGHLIKMVIALNTA